VTRAAAWRSVRTGALVLLLLLAAARAAAQGAGVDTLTGVVTGPNGAGLAGALVRATDESRRTAAAVTDGNGRFTFRLPSAGGRYVLSVQRVGYAPASVLVAPDRTGGRLSRDVRLRPLPVSLDTVRAQGARSRLVRPPRTPGEHVTSLLPTTTETLPLEAGALADVAALSPGVVRVPGADSSGLGLSIGGQNPAQNSTTLDGASYGGGSVPQEGLRSTSVVTGTYDVSRGQFSGGQVAATTRSGTNAWGGAVSGFVRDRSLQYGNPPGGGPAQGYTLGQLSAGGGGPLVHDRLFGYAAVQATRRTSPAASLDGQDAAALRRLAVSADSVRRFRAALRDLGAPDPVTGGGEARLDNASALVRLDLALSPAHTLTARADWRGRSAEGLGRSPLGLAGTGTTLGSGDAGWFAQLASRGGAFSNELRVYGSRGWRRATPALDLPAGRVRVSSRFDDGGSGVSTLEFGGSAAGRGSTAYRSVEAADALSRPLGRTHRAKAGAVFRAERAEARGDPDALGTFWFGSIADLEEGRPSEFTRSLSERRQEAATRYAALFAGDAWRPSPGFGLEYGLRLDRSWYPGRPAANPAVDSLFGLHPGAVPAAARVSPRVGFGWDLPSRRRPARASLHGGVGRFQGVVQAASLAGPRSDTGLRGAQDGLVCVGPAAPAPDWPSYGDPAAIPSACAGGAGGFASRVPGATVFAPGFSPPHVWNGSLGGSWQVADRYSVQADGALLRGLDQPAGRDLNLRLEPAFRLAEEAGRPVYAPADAVDPASGGVSAAGSRRFAGLGTVRELSSRGRSSTAQGTVGLTGLTGGGGLLSLTYTFTRSRDVAGSLPVPGGPAASAGGDPARLEGGRSDLEQRHSFQALVTRRLSPRLSVTTIARLSSGLPFSPVAAGDVNGDGSANDRAFVFDPRSARDTAVVRGMAALLADAPAGVRACLRRQLGRVAARNSCSTPWSPAVDVQANLRFGAVADRRVAFSVTAVNVTAGLDYLLHGPGGLRGWGQLPIPDRTLLYVRGFDPSGRAFRYEVNPSFGSVAGARGILRQPFLLALQGRVTVGRDPAAQPLLALVNGIREGGISASALRETLLERLPNAPERVLDLNAASALDLTPAQFERLEAAAGSLRPRIAAVADSLVRVLRASRPERRTVAQRADVERLAARGKALLDDGLAAARAILTREQWDRLPPSLTEPRADAPIVPPRQIQLPIGGS
jgi:hypothetical protein